MFSSNKTLLTSALGLMLSLVASHASALVFNLANEGDVSIKFDFYSAECMSGVQSCYGGNIDNPDPTMPTGSRPGNGTFNETTFGVGRITSIAAEPGSDPILWQAGQDGEQLLTFLYGVADKQISGPNGNGDYTILNMGCLGGACDGKIHLDVYAVPKTQFFGFTSTTKVGGVTVANPKGLKTANRTSFNTFTGITDIGQLVFKSEFTQGTRGIDGANDLLQTTRAATLPTSGSGTWLADCVEGPACDWFDKNSQTHGSDFFGQYTLAAVTAASLLNNGWLGYNNDPILTSTNAPIISPDLIITPEPNILAFFASALLGLSFFRHIAHKRN